MLCFILKIKMIISRLTKQNTKNKHDQTAKKKVFSVNDERKIGRHIICIYMKLAMLWRVIVNKFAYIQIFANFLYFVVN